MIHLTDYGFKAERGLIDFLVVFNLLHHGFVGFFKLVNARLKARIDLMRSALFPSGEVSRFNYGAGYTSRIGL